MKEVATGRRSSRVTVGDTHTQAKSRALGARLFGAAPTPDPSPERGFRYRPGLDGLRAIAVVTVVAFHARGGTFPGGYIGVDFFFVLSGYLITSLLVGEHRRTGRISFTHFYARRALRLLPGLILVCSVVVVAWLLVPSLPDHNATLTGVVTALTYTSSPVAAGQMSHLGAMLPTWSLSVEEYFYFLWPLLLLALMSNAGRSWRIAVGAIALSAIAYRWWTALGAGWDITRIAYGADTRAEQLLIGCGLAIVLLQTRRNVRASLGAAAAGLLVVFVLWPGDQTHEAYRYGGSTVIAIAAALVIAHVVQQPSSALGRSLCLRPLVWLGQRSYGVYLWHVPLIAIVAASAIPGSAQLPVKLTLIFVVPALAYRYVERPCLGFKHRFDGTPSRKHVIGEPASSHTRAASVTAAERRAAA
jgi:peptidoglycan/LPS O-acetylase OafA/YrhL